jgi:mannose-6-phosphate isomerase-like protein (cupin superfamily)
MSNNFLTNPMLEFLSAEQLTEGVFVKSVDYAERKKPFTMTYFEVQPGCTTPLDKHDVIECWIILRGTGELKYNQQILPAKVHDIFYFDSQQTHQITALSDEALLICSIYWSSQHAK